MSEEIHKHTDSCFPGTTIVPQCGISVLAQRQSLKRARYICRQRNSMNFRDTSRVNQQRAERWHKDGRPWTASDWAVALTGELGELCNLIKKLNRVNDGIASTNNLLKDGKPMDLMSEIKTEIGDVFLYLDLLSTHLGIDLETAVIDTFNRVSERESFPEKLPY